MRGQKLEKLLSNHEAQNLGGRISAPIFVFLIVIMNLFVLFGRPPSTMDAVSASMYDGGRAISRKQDEL